MRRDQKSGKVGYGRPPRHTRFKPGMSGNPKGRPADSARSVDDGDLRAVVGKCLWKILGELVPIREGGRLKKVPKFEAVQRKLMAKAMTGDTRTTTKLLKILERYPEFAHTMDGVNTIEVSFVHPSPYTDDDLL